MSKHRTGVLCEKCGDSLRPLHANKDGKMEKVGLYYCWRCDDILKISQEVVTR